MTIQFNDSKPSPEEVAHYGVKGMRWGTRKAKSGGSAGSSKPKPKSAVADLPPTSRDINSARERVTAQERAIRSQRKTVKKTGKGGAKLAKMEMDFLRNPDRATAVKMTDGEKLISTLFNGPGPTAWKVAGSELESHLIKRQVQKAGGRV